MDWHRSFGLALTDYFTDSAYRVELEKDLSLKQQFVDVVIIEQETNRALQESPDGLENLGRHNLLTYKSIREPLTGWALDELLGHFVNYRKQISPSWEKLLPIEDFRLYAVTTRWPEKLATETEFTSLKEGISETKWGSQRIRIIVLSQVPQAERNAIWQLFSAEAEKVQYGADHYLWRQENYNKLIYQLYRYYHVEGVAMPYTWEDFEREFDQELLERVPAEERIKGLPPEVRLKGLPPEVRLKGLPAEARLKGLPAEARLKGLPAEARLKGLPAKEIEAYLKKLRQQKSKKKINAIK